MSNSDDNYLECPCCGDVGANAHDDGYFYDGDTLVCGCNGSVLADEDEAWISINYEEPCPASALCNKERPR